MPCQWRKEEHSDSKSFPEQASLHHQVTTLPSCRHTTEPFQIGGSICGLMHGIMFKRLGHNVHILEQANSARAGHAAGMAGRDDVLEYMKIYDLVEQPWYIDSPKTQFLNKEGDVTRTLGKALCMTSWTVLYHQLRANFDGYGGVFVKKIPEKLETDGDVILDEGKKVVDLLDLGEHVEVRFQDVTNSREHTILADLVIGADGSNSFMRQKMLPEVKSNWAGYVAFRGCVPQADVSVETLKVLIEKVTVFKSSSSKSYILLWVPYLITYDLMLINRLVTISHVTKMAV